MNVVFSNVFGFIFAALGAVLVQYAWPNAFTHLKNIAKSAELFKAGEQASAESSPPTQEGLLKESTHGQWRDHRYRRRPCARSAPAAGWHED